MKLSVVIPVYNEAATIREILRKVCSVPFEKEVIVVDDGSTDGTRDILRDEAPAGIVLLSQDRNRGKGAALRAGFQRVTGDIVLVQDADLEYDPADYPRLLKPILDGKADVVYGSRFGSETHRVLFFWHYVGNHVLTTLSNVFTNLNLTDVESCDKVVRTEVLKSLRLRSNGFDIEPELTAKLTKRNARIYEVPISYSGRTYEEGKKIGWRDGVHALRCVWAYGVLHR